MSTADFATLEVLAQKVRRPFRYEMDDSNRCVSLDLTSNDDLYHGLIRHHTAGEREEILRLVCQLSALKRLNLRRNKVGRLPSGFCELKELEWLNLGSNSLGRVPEVLRTCTRLKFLHLGNNGLSELPGFIGELKCIEYLALHKNMRIKCIAALEGLEELRHLNLHYLNLHELPRFIYGFKKLVTLTLWNVRKFSDELATLHDLEFFSDCGCVGMRRLPEAFTQLKKLRMVRLFQNALEELPESIGELENLEQLSLYQNQLHDLPESFARLTRLKKLNLGWNRFRSVPGCLASCRSLQWLGIFENPLKHGAPMPPLSPQTVVQRTWPFTTLSQEPT